MRGARIAVRLVRTWAGTIGLPLALVLACGADPGGGGTTVTVSCDFPAEGRCYEFQGLAPNDLASVRRSCPGVLGEHACARGDGYLGCETTLVHGKEILWVEPSVSTGTSSACDGKVVPGGAGGSASPGGGGGGSARTGSGGRGPGGSGTTNTGGASSSLGTGGARGGGGASGTGLPAPPPISGPPPPAGCPPVGYLAAGSSDAIGLVKTAAGTIAVLDDRIVAFDSGGQVAATILSPRQIVSVASADGDRIVVADKAIATVYGPDLTATAKFTTAESCTSGVVVSGGRFVCGPAVDWQRMFYVYDTVTGGLLGTSGSFTYEGIAMRAVPGTDDFITIESGLGMFHVGADHHVTSVLNGLASSSFSATSVFAFDGAPPKHLVSQVGDMVALDTPCAATTPTGPASRCPVKDGQLGTLRTGETFLAMTSDAAGYVYGLVSPGSTSPPFGAACASGCAVQRIDAAQRLIVSQHSYVLGDLSAVRGLAIDERCGQLIVAYVVAPPSGSTFDPPAGHRIAVLAY